MMGIQGYIPCKYWIYIGKRKRNYYVSLVEKHGLLKVKFKYEEGKARLRFMVGTVEVMSSNDFADIKLFIEKYGTNK
jgi:hypothetical protein